MVVSAFKKHYLNIALLAIGLATVLAYSGIIHHPYTIYDDGVYVTANRHVSTGFSRENVAWAFTSGDAANWHPVTWLLHMTECQLFGLDATYHHLLSLLLHLCNSAMLFLLLRRMTGDEWKSAFVAAIFALHPLHVESVAWIAEQKDLLSSFFWLLLLWMYTMYVARASRSLLVSLYVIFAIGLMTKPMLVTLPFVLLLLDFWPLNRYAVEALPAPSFGKKRTGEKPRALQTAIGCVREKIPMFVLAIASSVITFEVQQRAGAMQFSLELPLPIRLANAAVAYVRYVARFFFPVDLAVIYPHPGANISPWLVVVSASIIIAITAFTVTQRHFAPPLAVGWLWFVGTVVPVSGIVQVGLQSMADRYMYVPMIGLSIALFWGVPRYLPGTTVQRNILTPVFIVILCALFLGTRMQVGYWRDDLTLFEHAIEVTSDNWVAHNNLAVSLATQGDSAAALNHYTEALRIRPEYSDAVCNLAVLDAARGRSSEAYALFSRAIQLTPADAAVRKNFGMLLSELGQDNEAIVQFDESLRLSPSQADVHFRLARIYASRGEVQNAIGHCRQAIVNNPSDPEALSLLGSLLMDQGDIEGARSEALEAIRIDPDNAEAHHVYARILEKTGDVQAAINEYRTTLQKESDNYTAHYDLGTLLARVGRIDEAIIQCSRAVQLRPDYADAHNNLGKLYAVRHEVDSATSHYLFALRSDSLHAMAHFNYGSLLAQQGHYVEAAQHFSATLRRRPDFVPAIDAMKRIKVLLRK